MKKFISLLLVLTLFANLTFAMAIDSENTHQTCSTNADEIDLNDYIQYTIDFPVKSDTLSAGSVTSDNSNVMAQHKNNVYNAMEYVKSLHLVEQGYASIEKSCLENLETYLSDDFSTDSILTSYTVIVPKSGSGMSYYGTWAGRDFYNRTYSMARFRESSMEWESTPNIIFNWVAGAVNLLFCWAPKSLSIPFTLVSTALGCTPSGGEIATDDAWEIYYSVSLVNRDILTENSLGHWGTDTSEYVTVYRDNYGTAQPIIVRKSAEASPDGLYVHETHPTPLSLEAEHYTDTTFILRNAYTRYMDRTMKGQPIVYDVRSELYYIEFK